MIQELKDITLKIIDQESSHTKKFIHEHTKSVLNEIEKGTLRVCEKKSGEWVVNAWIKQAILLYFKSTNMTLMEKAFDKVPLKTNSWTAQNFKDAGFRMVPGSIVRFGTYIAPSVVIMPSFINIGAYVDKGTMVDSLVTLGSCAQIGKNVHLSSNVVIGGVLEPLQAKPTIIEDYCFIGAGSSILEGMIIEEGAVIAAGTTLSSSTKIVDRKTGKIIYGRVPSYSVVVPGSLPTESGVSLNCAVIIKNVDAKTRQKTGINDLLRD